jgi:hypothetical protein
LSKSFDEIQVYENIAERTGVSIDRAGVRGNGRVCRSFTELSAKTRRLGDGYYYLVAAAWPAETKTVDLSRPWATMS